MRKAEWMALIPRPIRVRLRQFVARNARQDESVLAGQASEPASERKSEPVQRRWPAIVAWWLTLAVLGALAVVKIDLAAQYYLAFGIVGTMLTLRQLGWINRVRLFYLLCSAFLSFRYLYWRTTSTLGFNGVADFVFMMLMYFAEVYGNVVTLGGLFVNSYPLKRPVAALLTDRSQLPTIDVFIPSYNETPDLLAVTLRAACDMRYPGVAKVYLLDDGGTVQKCQQLDPRKAAVARARAASLRELAARHGAIYLTRERNEHAKAGNINAALAQTEGELVAVFDADHVPTADFLERTIGYFQRDAKLFLVQTPHFFINPDPLEKNLEMFGKMPPENEMFYSAIQRGLDFWNAAFFCGSAAVLRRTCVMEIGGITGTSITEDAETALMLHARGYRSVYLNEPLVSGLQPETFTSFVVQRVRWAQGMVQLLLLRNPLRMPGLTFVQRICYFSNAFFWFFSYARVVFLIAPAMYLLFGLQFYNSTLPQFFAYGLPQMIASILVTDYLFGKYRWTLISEVYEMLLSMFALRGIMSVLIRPRSPSFNVTPKGERSDDDQISELAGPFYLVYVGVLVATLVGVWQLISGDASRGLIISSVVWSVLNLILLNTCIGVLYERRQRRAAPRVSSDIEGTLLLEPRVSAAVDRERTAGGPADPETAQAPGGFSYHCRITDLSVGGAKLVLALPSRDVIPVDSRLRLEVFDAARGQISRLPLVVRSVFARANGDFALGVEFTDNDIAGLGERVSLVHGDSQRWREFRDRRNHRVGIRRSFGIVIRLGTVYAFRHYVAFCMALIHYVRRTVSAGLRVGRHAIRFVFS